MQTFQEEEEVVKEDEVRISYLKLMAKAATGRVL